MNLLAWIAKMLALYVCFVVVIAFYGAVSNPDDTELMRVQRNAMLTEEDMENGGDCIRAPTVGMENPLENKHLWPCYGGTITRKQRREEVQRILRENQSGYPDSIPALPPSSPRKRPERRKVPEPGVQYHYAFIDRRQKDVSGLPD